MKDRKSAGVELNYPHDHSMFCLGPRNEYFIAVGADWFVKTAVFPVG